MDLKIFFFHEFTNFLVKSQLQFIALYINKNKKCFD